MACEYSSIHEVAAKSLFRYFVRRSAAATLIACLSSKSKSLHYMVKGALTTQCQMLNHVLQTYTKDEIIAEATRKIARYVQRSTGSPLKFASEFSLQTLKYLHAYDEYVFQGSSSKAYYSRLGPVYGHTGEATRLNRCRSCHTWHRYQKLQAAALPGSSQPCSWTAGPSRIIVNQIMSERNLTVQDRRAKCFPDHQTAKKELSLSL